MLSMYRANRRVIISPLRCFQRSGVLASSSLTPFESPLAANAGQYRFLSTPVSRIRNTGILAHIDAGKTTTTEHILYLTGKTNSVGRVDNGDTVMDFLPQEKERGITISAAAISCDWKGHSINIIDTPGHIDFTMEVEVSTKVIDGCVFIIDAVSGVQCQTKTVWRKISSRNLPSIAFVNKMDRDGADLYNAINSIRDQLQTNPIPLHIPIFDEKNHSFLGFIDLLGKNAYIWPNSNPTSSSAKSSNNNSVSSTPHISPDIIPIDSDESPYYDELQFKRKELIEMLAEIDETFMQFYLETAEMDAGHPDITFSMLLDTIRRTTLARQILPVFCGAALKGKGVTNLLDGIIAFLPSPKEIADVTLQSNYHHSQTKQSKGQKKASSSSLVSAAAMKEKRLSYENLEKQNVLLGQAFKVVYDNLRGGRLVYVRLFHGKLNNKMSIFNTSLQKEEKIHQILSISGAELSNIAEGTTGNIYCLVGMKSTRSGDTLMSSSSTPLSSYVLPGMIVPKPVYSLVIEAESLAKQKDLEAALAILAIEDPSLEVEIDTKDGSATNGQIIVKGLGELHLEILCDKLKRQYKLTIYKGKASISYRESMSSAMELLQNTQEQILSSSSSSSEDDSDKIGNVSAKGTMKKGANDDQEQDTFSVDGKERIPIVRGESQPFFHVYDRIIDGKRLFAAIEFEFLPTSNLIAADYEIPSEVEDSLAAEEYDMLHDAMKSSLLRGPKGYPIVGMVIRVKTIHRAGAAVSTSTSGLAEEVLGEGGITTPGAIRACISLGIISFLSQSDNQAMLEPMMRIEIEVPDQYLGTVLSDLSSKRRADRIEIKSLASTTSTSGGSNNSSSMVTAIAPLQTLLGYATDLRSMTHGEGLFSSEYVYHAPVDIHYVEK